MTTPIFTQLVVSGTGQGYSTYVYGLGNDGIVYRWTEIHGVDSKTGRDTSHMEWIPLLNPDGEG